MRILLFSLFFLFFISSEEEEEVCSPEIKVRPSALKGKWYSDNKSTLEQQIKSSFSKYSAVEPSDSVRALILPHAGLYFTKDVLARTLKTVSPSKFTKIMILAPSHYTYYNGFSMAINYEYYETTLGRVKISSVTKDLQTHKYFTHNQPAHDNEHSIEILLPYLQYYFDKGFEIVPILVGSGSDINVLNSISRKFREIIGEDTLVIASSDFIHYGPQYGNVPFKTDIKSNLKLNDDKSLELIGGNGKEFLYDSTSETVCGKYPIYVLMRLFGDCEVKLEKYMTSGEVTGDYTNSVSYMGISFSKMDEHQFLLEAVKYRLEMFLKENKIVERKLPKQMKKKYEKIQGCFVTYKINGRLRGCIGHVYPHTKLYDCINENTISAAEKDRRFSPLTYEEYNNDGFDIEISILTEPQPLHFDSPEDLKKKIRKDVDGLMLTKGQSYGSTYLPSVWEQLPDKEEFLGRLCMKARLDYYCWKNDYKQLKIDTYQSIAFHKSKNDIKSINE